MPERFDIPTWERTEVSTAVMLHRTVFGSLERFLGILIEHFAGAFPMDRPRPVIGHSVKPELKNTRKR